jgi:peptide/nickel transport system substrate-binding protein
MGAAMNGIAGGRTSFIAAALLALSFALAPPSRAEQKILRVIPQADLKVLDTHFNSIQVTKIYALMVYDTLYAWDQNFQPKPQMVENETISPDKLTYTFTLRPGLKFHDGQPVTPKDVIPSLKRWMVRDVMGQKLAAKIAEMKGIDDRTFSILLKEPYPFVEFSLGSAGGQMPVIYREKEALTDPNTPITETIGSGPFKFNRAEWQPGSKIVFDKNTDYVPRSEPPDGLTGGKVVKVDRVEWNVIPDATTAALAIGKGEADFWDSPTNDVLPTLDKNKDVVVGKLAPFGNFGFLRVNNLFPPFNNVKARQALAYAFDQGDFMAAAYGDQKWWKICYSYFVCGAPYGTEVGSEPYRKQDLAKAKQLFADAGYKGETLTFITTDELPQIGVMARVAAATLQKIGVKIDLQVMAWGNVVQRQVMKDDPAKGGWNLFTSWGTGSTFHHPLSSIGVPMPCDGKNWAGWPCDEQAEKLRERFLAAPDMAARLAILEPYHRRLMEVQPYALLGQFDPPFVWRKNIEGVVPAAVVVYWNLTKSGT